MVKKDDFDYVKELNECEIPNMFKAGVSYHIKANNLNPKNKKELDKIIEDYGKIGIGGE